MEKKKERKTKRSRKNENHSAQVVSSIEQELPTDIDASKCQSSPAFREREPRFGTKSGPSFPFPFSLFPFPFFHSLLSHSFSPLDPSPRSLLSLFFPFFLFFSPSSSFSNCLFTPPPPRFPLLLDRSLLSSYFCWEESHVQYFTFFYSFQ